MSQVMSQQWNEWTAVTPQIINNELKLGISDAERTSSQQLRRLCPRNSLNHKYIGLTGHQLPLPQPPSNILFALSSTHLLIFQKKNAAVSWVVKHLHSGTKKNSLKERHCCSLIKSWCFDAIYIESLTSIQHVCVLPCSIFVLLLVFCFVCVFFFLFNYMMQAFLHWWLLLIYNSSRVTKGFQQWWFFVIYNYGWVIQANRLDMYTTSAVYIIMFV